MPPIHATTAWMIYENGDDKREAENFLREIFPKLKMSHEYFYKHRNPDGNGLVYIRHPWESGFDNSPAWDIPLRGINIDKSKLPLYERRDIKKGISKEERPTDEDYDRYIYLVDLFRMLIQRITGADLYGSISTGCSIMVSRDTAFWKRQWQ